ncbi:unnamed protein product, partial [Ectocarpus sp. 12 AP-2014]
MSYLSREGDVSREGTGLRKTQRKRAGRHTRQPTTNATRPENVESCTGSRRQNVAHVAGTHALKHVSNCFVDLRGRGHLLTTR